MAMKTNNGSGFTSDEMIGEEKMYIVGKTSEKRIIKALYNTKP